MYRLDSDGAEQILGSIGVDVSSDWKRFPRYGYTAWYERGKEQWVPGDVAFLNRRHINAVQFQDWHWKHHWPYCADDFYTDISMREISHNVVKMFIDVQHGYNMKSIFYNLGFGALDQAGAAADGVSPEWYYFLDPERTRKDSHQLPSGWKSDIFLVDPGNAGWQSYLCDRNEEVYSALGFDGFQVDQLGSRGDGGWVYDYWGNRFDLASHCPSLLKALKARHPSKTLIMNSVSRYGEQEIASSGVIDVCYNEMWADCDGFDDLYKVVASNRASGGNAMKTVFANYMNYDYGKDNRGKNFNTPGVLLTDAYIFALGGAHLELGTGYNMLCNEYLEAGDSHKERTDISKNIEREIDKLRSPKKTERIEKSVNEYMVGILSRLKSQCPFLKDTDTTFLMLIYAGFAPRAVCLFTGTSIKNFYAKRSRLRKRIEESDAKDKELFISRMS